MGLTPTILVYTITGYYMCVCVCVCVCVSYGLMQPRDNGRVSFILLCFHEIVFEIDFLRSDI